MISGVLMSEHKENETSEVQSIRGRKSDETAVIRLLRFRKTQNTLLLIVETTTA